MKKLSGNLFALIGCLGLLFMVSCSDKDNEAEETPAPKLGIYLPVGSTTRDPSINDIADSTGHAYDKNGRLIQFLSYSRYSPTSILSIEYDNFSSISKINVSETWALQEREYNAQGQLQKINYHHDQFDPAYISMEQTLKYDIAGRIIELYSIGYDKLLGNPPLHTFNRYTYNTNDLIATDSAFVGGASTTTGKPWFREKTEYQYDNKKGVNEFGLDLKGGYFSYLYLFAPLKHNITSVKATKNDGSVSQVTYLYEYNASDYPTKITGLFNGNSGSSRKITYGYF